MRLSRAVCAAIALAAALVAAARVEGQTILRVRSGAPDNGDGSSWAIAYNRLERALAAAGPGTEIWVAAGTYASQDAGFVPAFAVPSGVSVYGGFSGTETARDQRDPAVNHTVLSGLGTPGKTVLSFVGVDNVRVEGFTISGGKGHGDRVVPGRAQPGGGMFASGSTVTIARCRFVGNQADYGLAEQQFPAYPGCGGAAFVTQSVVRFENTEFVNNEAGQNVYSGGCSGGVPKVYYVAGTGGAIESRGSALTLVGCGFEDNAAGDGAQAGVCTSGHPNETSAGQRGGAIHAEGGQLVVERSVFARNRSGGPGRGDIRGPCHPVHGCGCFDDPMPPGDGGAIWTSASTTISNSLFVGNQIPPHEPGLCTQSLGGRGGGIFSAGSLTVVNSTFFGNSATGTTGGRGGAIGGTLTSASNCIFWNNTDGGSSARSAAIDTNTYLVLRNCIVPNMPTGSGNGNIGLFPAFVDSFGIDGVLGTADDRFDLRSNSPAIDAGNNSFVVGDLDLAGDPRRVDAPLTPDTGVGTSPIVDIGAYEYQPPCIADLDDGSGLGRRDGAVTISDLVYWLTCYEAGTLCADVDGDGAITIDELVIFLRAFEAGC